MKVPAGHLLCLSLNHNVNGPAPQFPAANAPTSIVQWLGCRALCVCHGARDEAHFIDELIRSVHPSRYGYKNLRSTELKQGEMDCIYHVE
jgi:hypothetical protein